MFERVGTKMPAQLTPRGDGVYDCVYYPEVEGKCKVDVNFANQSVPKRYEFIIYILSVVSQDYL